MLTKKQRYIRYLKRENPHFTNEHIENIINKKTEKQTKFENYSINVNNSMMHIDEQNDKKIVITKDKGIIISDKNCSEITETSVLHLESDRGGLLLPRLSNKDITTMNEKGVTPGTIIYNKDTDSYVGMTKKGWVLLSQTNKLQCVNDNEKDDLPPIRGTIIYNTDKKCVEVSYNKKWNKIIVE